MAMESADEAGQYYTTETERLLVASGQSITHNGDHSWGCYRLP